MSKRNDKPLCPRCTKCEDNHCRYSFSTFYVNCETITECPHFEERLTKNGRNTEE